MESTWLGRNPVRAVVTLAIEASLAYACYLVGHALLAPTEGLPADQRSLVGRYVAWGATLAFALLQLLDDHELPVVVVLLAAMVLAFATLPARIVGTVRSCR